MKKIIALACVCALGLAASAECRWSWWVGGPDKDRDITGCQLGIAGECASVKGAQVGLLWNRIGEVKNGCQWAIGYNDAAKVRNGPQLAFVNKADKAALQLGLLCFNKGGFLPFFVFFNFDKTMFGGEK